MKRNGRWLVRLLLRVVVAVWAALLCASVLSGPTGAEVTTAGTTGAIILAFLAPAYLIASTVTRKENTMPVNPQRVALLTAALRSDMFLQGREHLTTYPGSAARRDCCLGVACAVAEANGLHLDYEDYDGHRYYVDDSMEDRDPAEFIRHDFNNDVVLPYKVYTWYGFEDPDPELTVVIDGVEMSVPAAELNDEKGFSFAEIADAFDSTYVHLAEVANG